MNRKGNPSSVKIPHISTPTISVEINTPTVASTAIGHFSQMRSSRLMCRAPAKSRNASIPCNSAWSKSKSSTTGRMCCVTAGKTASSTYNDRENKSASAMSPIVVGSFSSRRLR